MYPTRAVDEYVSSLGGHAVEQSAHKVAARLRKSGNTQHRYVHSSGIAVGTCNRSGVQARAPAKKRPQAVSPCESTRHTGSADAPAKYAPQSSILHLLWTGPDATTERLPWSKRRQVCGGCRTSALRQLERDSANPVDVAVTGGDKTPSIQHVRSSPSALDLLSTKTSAQVPFRTGAAAAPLPHRAPSYSTFN